MGAGLGIKRKSLPITYEVCLWRARLSLEDSRGVSGADQGGNTPLGGYGVSTSFAFSSNLITQR